VTDAPLSGLLPAPTHAATARARAAERTAYAERLARAFVHEVRNPLHVLRINLQLLEESLETAGSPERERVRRLIGEVDRIERLLTRFVDLASGKPLALEPASIGEVLAAVLDSVEEKARRGGVEILRDLGDGLPPAPVDRQALHQAFLNLVLNALEAMPAGGRLMARVALSPIPGGERLKVEIHDDGHGIPEEFRSKVFEPFRTTKEGGTGLGLWVTRAIIEAHGGTISFESDPVKGTSFTVLLPVE